MPITCTGAEHDRVQANRCIAIACLRRMTTMTTTMKTRFVVCAMLACLIPATGCKQTTAADPTTSSAPEAMIKDAAAAYIYLYPLVTFGVSNEVLTNIEKPKWETLSAPLNQFMSLRQSRPDNHGVILPSTDTLYTLSWTDVSKEPVVFMTPAIPNVPGTTKKRFMMYEFMDAWTKVYYSNGLQKGLTAETSFIMVGLTLREICRRFRTALWSIAHESVVVNCAYPGGGSERFTQCACSSGSV